MAYHSNMNFKAFLLPLIIGVMALTGCQQPINSGSSEPAVVEPQPQPPAEPEMTEVQQSKANYVMQCQRELEALKTVNMRVYEQKKASFDNLVNNAAMYRSLREQVNGDTRTTLDALYEYKANQICADIRQTVMQNLIRQGERIR